MPKYAVLLSTEKRGCEYRIWLPPFSSGRSICQATVPVAAFQARTDPGWPKFGRTPATTTLPSGLTAGWSKIEPSENTQRR